MTHERKRQLIDPQQLLVDGTHPLEVLLASMDNPRDWTLSSRERQIRLLAEAWHPERLEPEFAERLRPAMQQALEHVAGIMAHSWRGSASLSSDEQQASRQSLQQIVDSHYYADLHIRALVRLYDWGWRSVLDIDAELPDRYYQEFFPSYLELRKKHSQELATLMAENKIILD